MPYYRFPNGEVYHFTGYTPKDGERLPAGEGKAARAAYCAAELHKLIQPGDTVLTVLRSVARSGMSRRLDLLVATGDKHRPIRCITAYAADLLGWKHPYDGQGMVVDGCGMDAGFHAVYSLGRRLWPDGTPEPHGTRNGEPDRCGGYAIKHQWI